MLDEVWEHILLTYLFWSILLVKIYFLKVEIEIISFGSQPKMFRIKLIEIGTFCFKSSSEHVYAMYRWHPGKMYQQVQPFIFPTTKTNNWHQDVYNFIRMSTEPIKRTPRILLHAWYPIWIFQNKELTLVIRT